MAVDLRNVGTPTVCNRAFVPLAIEAGIEEVIASLITLAMDKRTLLMRLVEVLWDTNRPLAEALNLDNLDAILRYMMAKTRTPVVFADDLPELLNKPGPQTVNAARDGGAPTQVNVSFTASPDGYNRYAIYLDGIFQKDGTQAAADGWINDYISDVPQDGQSHTIRVLFVDTSGDEPAITRFGPIATFS